MWTLCAGFSGKASRMPLLYGDQVCLNEFVLQAALLGLKTKGHRSYASVFREGQKTLSE